jgi:hypothetical protein
MSSQDVGRANLVFHMGADWSRTLTYYNALTSLAGVTGTGATGATSITVANGSASPVTFAAGELVTFGSDSTVYQVETGATINAAASGTIILEGTGLERAVAAGTVSQAQPFNLTGYTARMQVRATAEASSTILSLTSSPAAGITMGGAAGTLALAVTAAQLTTGTLSLTSITTPKAWVHEELPDGRVLKGYGKVGVYDVEIVSAGGVVTR